MHLEYLQGFCLTQSAVLYVSFTIQIRDAMTTKCRLSVGTERQNMTSRDLNPLPTPRPPKKQNPLISET